MNTVILVVDDQENMCWILSKVLSEAGFSVKTAGTAKEARFIANEGDISAAIIDYRLPDCNGFDLFRDLKNRDGNIQCVLITSYGSSDLREEALKLGFVAYFDKPIDNNALTAVLEKFLKPSGNPHPKRIGN